MSKTPIGEALFPHIRMAPDAMNKFEAEDFLKNRVKIFEQEANKILSGQTDEQKARAEAQNIKTYFADQFNRTRKFGRSVNKAYASFLGDFYVTMAHRVGMKPTEFLKKYQLRIQRSAATAPVSVPVGDLQQGEVVPFFKALKNVDAPGARKAGDIERGPALTLTPNTVPG